MSVLHAMEQFLSQHWQEIATIFGVAIAGELLLRFATRRLTLHASAHGDKRTTVHRAATVARLVHGAGHMVLFIVVLFWALRLIGIDPTPIIASAGVVGLAIGFGAQTLVKDFMSGMFIIAENQYGVGDDVVIGGNEGTVECLSVRSTVLRDKENNKIYIPNGSVSVVINRSKRNV